MSTDRIQLDSIGEHDYLVQLTQGEDDVEFRIRAAPAVLARLGLEAGLDGEVPEAQVIAATVEFLIQRQLAVDLPDMVDIEDVLAAYDDFPAEVAQRLG